VVSLCLSYLISVFLVLPGIELLRIVSSLILFQSLFLLLKEYSVRVFLASFLRFPKVFNLFPTS